MQLQSYALKFVKVCAIWSIDSIDVEEFADIDLHMKWEDGGALLSTVAPSIRENIYRHFPQLIFPRVSNTIKK